MVRQIGLTLLWALLALTFLLACATTGHCEEVTIKADRNFIIAQRDARVEVTINLEPNADNRCLHLSWQMGYPGEGGSSLFSEPKRKIYTQTIKHVWARGTLWIYAELHRGEKTYVSETSVEVR